MSDHRLARYCSTPRRHPSSKGSKTRYAATSSKVLSPRLTPPPHVEKAFHTAPPCDFHRLFLREGSRVWESFTRNSVFGWEKTARCLRLGLGSVLVRGGFLHTELRRHAENLRFWNTLYTKGPLSVRSDYETKQRNRNHESSSYWLCAR
jgi:hypothetical protein